MTSSELRKKHGLQQDIADRLDELNIPTTKAQVSRWENGINNPSIDQLIGLCRVYGVKDVYSVFSIGDLSDMEYSLNREGVEKLADYKKFIASGLYAPVQLRRPGFAVSKADGSHVRHWRWQVPDSSLTAIRMRWSRFPTMCRTAQHSGFMSAAIRWSRRWRMDRRFVQMQPTLECGDIGVFYLDGNAFVKEYRRTDNGVFLISHNEKYKPIPITNYI